MIQKISTYLRLTANLPEGEFIQNKGDHITADFETKIPFSRVIEKLFKKGRKHLLHGQYYEYYVPMKVCPAVSTIE